MKEASNTAQKPRRASTVILIREQEGELQVYLLKRSAQSGFMPESYVFPGGTLDIEDWDSGTWKMHVDMDLGDVIRCLGRGLSKEEVFAHSVAAIRETFEEAGVFLANRDGEIKGHLERIWRRRMAEGLPGGWLRDEIVSKGWTLAFSRLFRWAHWITPALRTRRYDTRFFLAFMPFGQECTPDQAETTHGLWITPADGLIRNLGGEILLSPPTLVTLNELLQYPDMKTLEKEVKAHPWGNPRLPRLIPSPNGALILLPWDPMYDQEPRANTKVLEETSTSLGEPFSRLWYHEGIWRPVQA
jgi:8-oxo-dGTP pyrophosphatase MutT (NUDIX family)